MIGQLELNDAEERAWRDGDQPIERRICHHRGFQAGHDHASASFRTPPPHTAAMLAWAKVRIAEIGELRRMEMVGFNELDEARRLEGFVGEWA